MAFGYKTLVRSIIFDEICFWLSVNQEDDLECLTFRLDVYEKDGKFTALLWRLDLYDIKPTFDYGDKEFMASEEIFVKDILTLPSLDELTFDTIEQVIDFVQNGLMAKFGDVMITSK